MAETVIKMKVDASELIDAFRAVLEKIAKLEKDIKALKQQLDRTKGK